MTLIKADIIDTIYAYFDSSNRSEDNSLKEPQLLRKECAETVEILIAIIKRTLANGEDVLISGFGKFCVKEKSSRKGRNPQTGESLILDPRRVVTFKCSSTLRRKLNPQKVI